MAQFPLDLYLFSASDNISPADTSDLSVTRLYTHTHTPGSMGGVCDCILPEECAVITLFPV